MTWQAITQRTRDAIAAARTRITRKRLFQVVLGTLAFGFVAITTEALFRAHIRPVQERLPSAVYTRPVPWTPSGEGMPPATRVPPPLAFGTLDGSPMEERLPVSIDELPTSLVQAVLATEDQRFYEHHGIDIKRIGGALVADVKSFGIVQGGSTITQQLAKNLFLSASRTPLRKIREMAMALMLELRYDKKTILEAYLNEIYLGQDGGRAIHGMGAAARYYLGKDVRRVTLAESAQLAAMISAPNRTVAARHPEVVRERRDLVLQLMTDQHRIAQPVAERAQKSDVTVGAHSMPVIDGRFFRDYAVSMLPHLPGRGVAVYTTLDATLQRAAEHAVASHINRLPGRGVETALVAIDPRTGEVLAMVGGRDYGASQFNRAVDARRQPGSAFKPIVALAALEKRGEGDPAFTLASVVEDEPLIVETPKGPWQPVDYDNDFRGPVTMREAMEQSLNVPFARIGISVGPDQVAAMGKRLGITSPLHPVPSLSLGSSEVSLLELVRAYGVLATSGQLAETRSVLGVNSEQLAGRSAQPVQVIDSAVTYLVTSMLEGVVKHGTGRALDSDDHLGGIAGKTGTSSNWRDALFVAYSPELVVGVWVGYDEGQGMKMTGAAAALPIAATFLAQVTPPGGWPEFDVPAGISEAYVSTMAGDEMDCGRREIFLTGTTPPDEGCGGSFRFPGVRGAEQWGADIERRAENFLHQLFSRRRSRGGTL